MKKQHFKLSLIGGMLIAMSASVNAQWTETGSVVYLNSTTKNVGIGTTTPAFALDLQRSGSANLSLKSTTGTSNLLLDRANSSATSSVSYRTNGVGTWQTGTVGNDNFNIRNIGLGNTAMSISAANNYVGLGVSTPLIVLDTKAGQTIGTTATTGTYHAAGNQGEKVSFGYVPSNAAGEFVGMKAVVNPGTNFCGNSGDILFNTWECNTSTSRPVMAINGTGNVGIGTTTPQGKLHINGGDLVLDNSNQRFFENGNPTWDISGGSSNYAIGRSGIDYPFVIDYATANVGIGTTTPAAKLDIMGDAKINGHAIGRGNGNIQSNVCFGNGALSNNASGYDNTATGYEALKNNTTGNFNVAIGIGALYNNTTGSSNTAIGIEAGGTASNLNYTTAIGATAIANANNATAIGSNAVASGINSTAIGAGANAIYDNTLILGNNASVGIGTENPYAKLEVKGDVGSDALVVNSDGFNADAIAATVNNGGANTAAVYGVNSGSGYAGFFSGKVTVTGTFSNPSDERLKENIKPLENAMNLISKLNAKTYSFKEAYSKMNLPQGSQYGLIAQEVEKVMPNLVTTNYDKTMDKENPFEFKAINYIGLIPVLTQAVNEQNEMVNNLITENADLKIKNAEIQSQLNEMQQCVLSLCENQNSAAQKASSIEPQVLDNLFQNTPNPFNQTTVIRYALNSDNNNGKIIIRDLNGNLVKQVNIANGGKGQVTINANELAAGTYTYTLEIAGASVDTKLMVVTK